MPGIVVMTSTTLCTSKDRVTFSKGKFLTVADGIKLERDDLKPIWDSDEKARGLSQAHRSLQSAELMLLQMAHISSPGRVLWNGLTRQ